MLQEIFGKNVLGKNLCFRKIAKNAKYKKETIFSFNFLMCYYANECAIMLI